jgi:nucleotidyltransferase/DNA polymerase involved in DNA repair
MYRGRFNPGSEICSDPAHVRACKDSEQREHNGEKSIASTLGELASQANESARCVGNSCVHRRHGMPPRPEGISEKLANRVRPSIASEGVYRRHGMPPRIACILVADFPVAAIARANPALREYPFAITRIPPAKRFAGGARSNRDVITYQSHSELSDISPHARAAGVRTGMTVAQARALIPDLVVIHRSSVAERAAADALIDAAESISPVVEEGEQGCVWLDLTGSKRFYRHSIAQDPSDTVENAIAEEIMRRARRIGLEAAVGIATSKEAAHLAARCGGARIIPPGKEREFLDWMPLDLIGLGTNERGDDLETMLKRLGIRRLGDLARLDGRAVGTRLGNRGAELMRLARGEGSATVIARPRVETFTEAVELEYGIENLEPLNFVMRAMIGQLTERLAMRGMVAGDLTLALGLADHRRDERRVTVAAATIEVRSLLTLINLSLEASPPPAAVETIRLTAEPRTPRPAQADMFIPPSPAPDRLEAAMARIAAMCGPDRVGVITSANSHRSEAVRIGTFSPPPAAPVNGDGAADNSNAEMQNIQRNSAHPRATRVSRSCARFARDAESVSIIPGNMNTMAGKPPAWNATARMVMRTMRPAEEVEVMCTRETPKFVRGKNICARVVSAAGPWRRQGEWWAAAVDDCDRSAQPNGDSNAASWQVNAPAAYARDYYELALEDGGVYRMYCDLYSGKWFVDGLYD